MVKKFWSNFEFLVNRVFLADKELNIVSYSIELSVLQYQTAVMREDFDTANEVLPAIPKESRARVAHFLEKQGFKKQALAVTTDPEHQFDLALQVEETKYLINYDSIIYELENLWIYYISSIIMTKKGSPKNFCNHESNRNHS